MRISNITCPDVNNGEGFRVTLWVQGCSHHCKGCHNKQTWDFKGGVVFDDEKKDKLFSYLQKDYIKGLTISGGDPIDSYDDVLSLVKEVKEVFTKKDIWLYTGYTFEMLYEKGCDEILEYVDVVVDGEFKEEMKDLTLPFRGSSNQRLIKKEFWKN